MGLWGRVMSSLLKAGERDDKWGVSAGFEWPDMPWAADIEGDEDEEEADVIMLNATECSLWQDDDDPRVVYVFVLDDFGSGGQWAAMDTSTEHWTQEYAG